MGHSDECNIDLLAAQQFEQFTPEALFQSHGYERIGFTKRPNGTRYQAMKRTCGHNPDADPTLFPSRRAPGRFESMIELGKDSTRIGEEGMPGIGEFDTACSSVK